MTKFIPRFVTPLGLLDGYFRNVELSQEWKKRILDVKSSPDNRFIERVDDAGKIRNGVQIMHNGLKIRLGSYYGAPLARLLFENSGVHEPQEERVFQEVLKIMPLGATIVELGAYWGFYSMWFCQKVEQAKAYLVEPEWKNLRFGKSNFELNLLRGHFFAYAIGADSTPRRTVCVDDFVSAQNIEFVDILHADIQGAEFEMLKGARTLFDAQKIGYVFISTHSDELHRQCLEFLISRNFSIIAEADLQETYAYDGLIVACAPNYASIGEVKIAKRGKPLDVNF